MTQSQLATDGYKFSMAEAGWPFVPTDAFGVRTLPRSAVFYNREPVFTVTSPSALVSWLEPLVLMRASGSTGGEGPGGGRRASRWQKHPASER